MNSCNYRCFFEINQNDTRSDFFLLVLNDIISRNLVINNFNFFNSFLIKHIRDNNELKTYLLDLSTLDSIIDLTKCNIKNLSSNYITIIRTFFLVQENGLDITNDISRWKNATKLVRKKDKIIANLGIIPIESYTISDINEFKFNISILNNILRSMINDIPARKQLDYTIDDVIYKCIQLNKDKLYANYLDKCIEGTDIKSCINFMSSKTFEDNIVGEVKTMDICDAVVILIKFGFLYNTVNNKATLETINTWENRIKSKLQIKEINKNLIKYLKLLHQRINPVNELRDKINNTNLGISSIMSKYSHKNPNYSNLINKYIILEKEHNIAQYINHIYYNLMNIFNNKYYKNIFNRNNMYKYNNYYSKINSKYLISQSNLLDIIEKKYKS
jgi:hypothetical protein